MEDIETAQKKSEKYDVQLKIIIIGDSSVGKSCILNYYLKNTCKNYRWSAPVTCLLNYI